jgi:hypothetical protein
MATFEHIWGDVSGAASGMPSAPLTGVIFQALVDAGGTLPKDDLVRTTNRSPHLVRETIQELADSGRLIRSASDGAWQIHLTFPEDGTDPASE